MKTPTPSSLADHAPLGKSVAAAYCPRGGFTLIELLVVIAVVLLLAAIVLPIVSTVRDAADMGKSTAHIRQNGIALNAFAAEYGGRYPPGTNFANNIFGLASESGGWMGWYWYINVLYFNGARFDEKFIPYDPSIMDRVPPKDRAPAGVKQPAYPHHYSGYGFNRNLSYVSGGKLVCKAVDTLASPAKTPLLWTDMQFDQEGYNVREGGTPSLSGSGGGAYRFVYPYNDKGLLLMVDGSVRVLEKRGNNRAPDYPEFAWGG